MMKTLVRLWLYAGGLSLVFAAGVGAQEIAPAEIPDSRVSPVMLPTADDPILAWHISYSGASNSTIANGEVANTIEGGAARQWSFHRGAFNIAGTGSQYFYLQATEQTRFTFDVGVSGSYQISRRAQLIVSDRISSGYARQASSVTESQLAFPNAIVTSNGFSIGYGYQLSRRTQFQASGQVDNLIFDSSQPNIPPPTEAEQALLHGGGTASFRTSIGHLLSHSDTIGLSQEYSRSFNGAEQAATNSVHGTWRRPLSPTYNLSAEGGVDIFTTDRLTGLNFAPTGSVTVSRKVRRNGSLGVRLAQTVEVIGATHVSTSINVDGDVRIGKSLTIGGSGSYVHNNFPGRPEFNYSPLILGAVVSYRLPANLVVSGAYTDWQRISGGDSSFLATRTTIYKSVSLSYGRTWR